MAGGSTWGVTPRESVEAEVARRGPGAVVAGCAALLLDEDVDPALVRALGGPGADKFFDGHPHEDTYWLRVWGARGLLWIWDDRAHDAIVTALRDESWRVREMAAKVAAKHGLTDALPAVGALREDPVPRVRSAAERAVARLNEAGDGGLP